MRNNYLLSLFILLALLPVLIFRDYTPSNELRYLSIVDEALRSGHFLTFTNQGLPYADKPPLYFWLLIFSRWLLGGHYMWFLGLFSLVPALVVMGVMDRWVRGEVSADNRFTGRLMLMTCGLFLGLAIILRMDMLMCMFIVLSLYTFYRMQRGEGNHRRNAILFPVYVFLAVFSKGPVGILVPLLVSV
ncbi:MAG: glycosyltransferase family 39 protein, partial [Bacteroides sp.]